MNCQYGCGQTAKFRLKNGKFCCVDDEKNCPVNNGTARKTMGQTTFENSRKNLNVSK